jgi:probable rRNA maturation factor
MELRLFREAKTRLPGKKIRELFELVTAAEGKPSYRADINIVFTTDQRMRVLNRTWRKFDKPTDVLSFTVDSPEPAGAVFGEIYVSVPTAKRQAEAAGQTLVDELLWLVCHGLLHLFGYDHKKAAEAAAMKRLEAEYLDQVGVRGRG